jgi:acetyltransferase-like isoleucine patch superfamily enzyme
MTSKQLVFLGASANISIYAETASRQGISIAGIVDQDYFGNTDVICDIPVIGSEETFFKSNYNDYFIFIGSNCSPHSTHARDTNKRLNFMKLIKQFNIKPINLVDPSAIVSNSAILGSGIFIGSNVTVEPHCAINDFVQLFYNVSVGYGSSVGENSSIQNNSTLIAHIGTNSFVGMTSKIFPYFAPGHIEIGNDVLVYPNMCVHQNLENNFIFREQV